MKFTAQGDLDLRLRRNYDRLEDDEYTPAAVFAATPNNQQWPGDYPGRVILALVHLARATGRQPKHLDALLDALPAHLNAAGYMGEILPEGVFDEQQFSGHGWLVSGLLEHHSWTGNTVTLELARTIVRNLFLPARGYFRKYSVPIQALAEGEASGTRKDTTVSGWQLSTDVGCAFISLEGMMAALRWMPSDELRAVVEEGAERFLTLDVRAVSAQTHATLTVTRNLLKLHDLSGSASLLGGARRLYALYRAEAMTENYANYNWFNRPQWTEPCAIVDSLIVVVQLWRKTGETSFLEDAHNIYYNALGYAQKPHGGFGCDTCVGATGDVLSNRFYDVTWCCNMRGAVGLAFTAGAALVREGASLVLPFHLSGEAVLADDGPNGRITVETTYPAGGRTTVRLDEGARGVFERVEFFVPVWMEKASVAASSDGQPQEITWRGSFASVAAAEEVTLEFAMPRCEESALRPDGATANRRYRQGPLLLGETPGATVGDVPTLAPLNNVLGLTETQARQDRRRVLFSDQVAWPGPLPACTLSHDR